MPRKRQRNNDKGSDHVSGENAWKRTKCPFQGRVVAISTSIDAEASAEGSKSYSQVADKCKRLGASISGQVHKRVYCVIASESAISTATQRVRKGWKKMIPVVTTDYAVACEKAGALIAMDDYRVEAPGAATKVNNEPRKVDEKETLDLEDPHENVVKVDLGCCCSCHDTDKAPTCCEWCVKCNVNQLARAK